MPARRILHCLLIAAAFPVGYCIGACTDRCALVIGTIYGDGTPTGCDGFLDCVKYDDFTCVPFLTVDPTGAFDQNFGCVDVGTTWGQRYWNCQPTCDPGQCSWREGKQYSFVKDANKTETILSQCQQGGGGT